MRHIYDQGSYKWTMHFGHVEFGKMELQLILTKQVCLFESMRKPPLAWKRFGFHPQSCAEIWTKGKNIPTVHRKWSCVFSSFKFTSKTHSHNGNSAPKMQKSSIKAIWICTLLAAVITLSCSCHPVVERIPSVPLGYLGHCYALQGTRTPGAQCPAGHTPGSRFPAGAAGAQSTGLQSAHRALRGKMCILAKMGFTQLCPILHCFLGKVLALYVQICIA